jgi:hypothetical protein
VLGPVAAEAKIRERYHWLFSHDAVGCQLCATRCAINP